LKGIVKPERLGTAALTLSVADLDADAYLPLAAWVAVMTAVPTPLIVTVLLLTVATFVLPLL
jgi:hypothetical protein